MTTTPPPPRPRPLTLPAWAKRRSMVPLVRVAVTSGAGDALVAVALANTVFFQVPVGEARGRVALYLLLTMAPFAVVAPVVGPLLDRFRAGRRGALAVTFGGRALFAWVLAQAPDGLRVYPMAFGILVLAKAYGVAKSAAIPRLLPEDTTLVGANSRLSGTTIVASSLVGILGFGLGKLVGYGWTLRLAAVVFTVGAVLALLLPKAVDTTDSAANERVRMPPFPPPARRALLTAVSLRALVGFLTIYLAFLLRRRGSDLDLGLLAGAIAVGSAGGTALGVTLRATGPERLLVLSVVPAAVFCAVGAYRYQLGTAILAILAACVASSLAKIALDATMQRDVGEDVRGQAFARSETVMQLSWVAGGGVGLALPLGGSWGLGIGAVALAAATAWVWLRDRRGVPVT